MKKYLLLLILPFIFLSDVKADECINLLPEYSQHHYYYRYANRTYYYSSAYDENTSLKHAWRESGNYNGECDNSDYLCLDVSKNYTFFVLNSDNEYVNIRDINGLYQLWLTQKHKAQFTYADDGLSATFTPNYGIGFDLFTFVATNDISSTFDNVTFVIVEGDNRCIPSPPSQSSDSPITDFYSLYLDKLSLLSNYSLENKYLLSFVSILLIF